MPYVQAHGLKVDVQVPQAFVGASTVIDSEAALKAASISQNLVANSGNSAGLAGLLVASVVNTQVGSGSLQRDAEKAALKDSQPMADLLGGVALQERLQQRYQRASQSAGLKQGEGQVTARLLIEPKLMLTPGSRQFCAGQSGAGSGHCRFAAVSHAHRGGQPADSPLRTAVHR